MTDPTVTTEWQTTLARIAHGLDLDTGEGTNEFRYQADAALRAAASLETLQALAMAVGAAHEPYDEYEARRVILANWTATACGLGTDRDIDAHTHCPACRSPYRREPARAESLWIATNVCTDDDCGYYTSVLDEHGRIVVERPAEPAAPPETRRRRLARWIDPYVGPGSLWVPSLRRAVAERAVETVGSLLDPVAEAMPDVRRTGWTAAYFLASRAHRGAARLARGAAELQAEVAEVARWVSYRVDDREGKDGDL